MEVAAPAGRLTVGLAAGLAATAADHVTGGEGGEARGGVSGGVDALGGGEREPTTTVEASESERTWCTTRLTLSGEGEG